MCWFSVLSSWFSASGAIPTSQKLWLVSHRTSSAPNFLTRIMWYSISVIIPVVSSGPYRCLLLSKSPSAVEQHVLQLWVLLLYLLCCCCQPWPSTPSIRTCSLFLFLCSLSTHFGFQYRQDLWPSYTSCWIVETHWSSTFLRPWHWSLTKNAAGDKETDKE